MADFTPEDHAMALDFAVAQLRRDPDHGPRARVAVRLRVR